MRGIVSGLLFLFAATSWAAAREEPEWLQLSTPRFTVVSQLDERRTRAWAKEFDTFIASTMQLVASNVSALPPVTVVLFGKDSSFAQYKPAKPNGEAGDNVVGWFFRRPGWGVIALAADADPEQVRQTIYHEAAHWIMSTDRSPRPMWVEEGMAELLSTFEVKGDKVIWGKPLDRHLSNFAYLPRLAAQTLFNTRDDHPMFNRDDRAGSFYASSWVLAHYLVFGHQRKESRQQLAAFLKNYATQRPDEAFANAFHTSYDELDSDLKVYIKERRYTMFKVPAAPVPEDAVVAPASPVVVQNALGRLAFGTGRTDLAATHADGGLSADPSNSAVRELRSLLASRAARPEQATHEAEMALRLGSRDADMYLTVAHSKRTARERADYFERAINASPRAFGAYLGLADALEDLDAPSPEDLSFLALGRSLYPRSAELEKAVAPLIGDSALADRP